MTARARRKRLLLWSAVPVFLVLCIAAKLLSLNVLGDHAISGYAARNAPAVEAAAGGLGLANVVEPHKAPFAAGDAAVLAGDYGTAKSLFEQALGMVPAGAGDECLVLVNLVLVTEHLGDQRLQAGDPSSALTLFKEALATAGKAPEGCLSPDAAAGAAGRLAEARERLEGKLGAAGRREGPEGAPAEESPRDGSAAAQQSQLDRLQENSRQAQRERNNGREREEYLDNNSGTGPDRPW